MNRDHIFGFGRLYPALIIVMIVLFSGAQTHSAYAAARKWRMVSVVFFFSKECEHCESALALLNGVKKKYPIRVKKFDIDVPKNYAL